VALLLLMGELCANAQQPTEYQVKAVFIYNFVNFVEWPSSAFPEPVQPFIIGVAGQNVFENSLAQVVSGETYRGRRIEIRMIDNAKDAAECQIVFLSANCPIIPEILSVTAGKAILTVSDSNDFLKNGGMIRFFLEESKVKIEVNQSKTASHHLQISSKLLRVAKIYKP